VLDGPAHEHRSYGAPVRKGSAVTGWATNRWVRLIAAVLIAWAALDALVTLLSALFPGHYDAHHRYIQSDVAAQLQRYWNSMYWSQHPNWTRLLAVLRYGATIAVCLVAVWSLRRRPGDAS
jgi:hypothetical protein